MVIAADLRDFFVSLSINKMRDAVLLEMHRKKEF